MNLKKSVVLTLLGVLVLGVILFISVYRHSFFGSPPRVPYDDWGVGDSWGGTEQASDFSVRGFSAETGLGSNARAQVTRKDMMLPEPPMNDGGSVAVDIAVEDRLIIKTGTLNILVEQVTEAAKTLQNLVEAQGGFVVSSNINDTGPSPSARVVVRIPSNTFDTVLVSAQGLGQVRSETVSGQDVTEEFVDLEAQLANYKATEEQFLTIMNRAEEIEDVLAVQRELTQVRGQIERIEGRMRYLQQSSSFSSLTVNLSTDPKEVPVIDENDKWEPVVVIKDATRGLITLLVQVVTLVIWVAIYSPVWFVLILVAFMIYRRHKRKKLNQ